MIITKLINLNYSNLILLKLLNKFWEYLKYQEVTVLYYHINMKIKLNLEGVF